MNIPQQQKSTDQILAKLVELSALSFQYGEIFRATTYPDGETFESDTDHSFMLGMIACSLRDMCAPELDRGKIAEYALVHDFVEVYAGDTPTLGIIDKTEKDRLEYEALLRIKSEYDQIFPWIGVSIENYESQSEPEARFIKVVDKLMPGLTQIQNNGECFDRMKIPANEIIAQKNMQRVWLAQTAHEWPLLVELYDKITATTHSMGYFTKK
jgi:putative hydrolase of HD superfamily